MKDREQQGPGPKADEDERVDLKEQGERADDEMQRRAEKTPNINDPEKWRDVPKEGGGA